MTPSPGSVGALANYGVPLVRVESKISTRLTYYVLFFIHLESRRVSLAGITRHPDQAWMQQMARNATGESWGFLDQRQHALHDRDTKFCSVLRATLTAGGIKPIQLPARSPNLKSHADAYRS
jgi:hypothetical protein